MLHLVKITATIEVAGRDSQKGVNTMRHLDLYKKYKINYQSAMSPMLSTKSIWLTILIILVVLLTEPLILYKYLRKVSFSLDYYFKQIEYFSFAFIPFGALQLWLNWRANIKRNRGYGWVGNFEVLDKRASLLYHYLLLTPGHGNQIKVNRELFEATRVGDSIEIYRNALGGIEKVCNKSNFSKRIGKLVSRRDPKQNRRFDLEIIENNSFR